MPDQLFGKKEILPSCFGSAQLTWNTRTNLKVLLHWIHSWFTLQYFIFPRLRIITNQIIDRLTGKKHRLEEVADEHHKLREKLRDEKLSRDLADMEAEAELLQAMIDFEDLRHKKFTDYARSSTD